MSSASSESLLKKYIPPVKQGAKRHYGIHPYFTRRPWNVVQEYIRHYAPDRGGLVLDPFGGSGVSAIEAAVLGKVGVQYDINPLANFIAEQIAKPNVNLARVASAGENVVAEAKRLIAKQSERHILRTCWYPKDIKMPENADVDWLEELFTQRQLAELALLNELIQAVGNKEIRDLLLLAFSGTLAKTNRTFISAKNRAESRGGSTILSLYRYHVPRTPVEILPIDQFEMRLTRTLRVVGVG